MDPISSTTAGVVSPKTTPAAPETAATPAHVADGHATAAVAGTFAGPPAAAGTSDIPEPPASRGLGQDVLDKAFKTIEDLERQMKDLDPTSPKDMAKMSEITRKLNRCDEMIRLVNEMRRSRHETNMAAINNIA